MNRRQFVIGSCAMPMFGISGGAIYITEFWRNRKLWAGPEIKAYSWAEAKAKAHQLGVKLLGKLG